MHSITSPVKTRVSAAPRPSGRRPASTTACRMARFNTASAAATPAARGALGNLPKTNTSSGAEQQQQQYASHKAILWYITGGLQLSVITSGKGCAYIAHSTALFLPKTPSEQTGHLPTLVALERVPNSTKPTKRQKNTTTFLVLRHKKKTDDITKENKGLGARGGGGAI